jgi:hypothetical protein
MSYGFEMCNSFQWNRNFVKRSPATGGNSACPHIFVSGSIEKAFPLRAPLLPADTVVTLPLAHLRPHVLPNSLRKLRNSS